MIPDFFPSSRNYGKFCKQCLTTSIFVEDVTYFWYLIAPLAKSAVKIERTSILLESSSMTTFGKLVRMGVPKTNKNY